AARVPDAPAIALVPGRAHRSRRRPARREPRQEEDDGESCREPEDAVAAGGRAPADDRRGEGDGCGHGDLAEVAGEVVGAERRPPGPGLVRLRDETGARRAALGHRKRTRLNSSHEWNSYAVCCWKKKTTRV